MTRLAIGVIAVASAVLAAQSQSWRFDAPMLPQPRSYACFRASSALTIDGRLDDPAWAQAQWSDAFLDIEGDARPAPALETRVKMLWDDTNFYIAANLSEPHLWATLTEHDAVIFRDNDFEVFIDPNGDNHEYGELELNALNTTWDLFLPKPYKDDGKAVNGWEIAGMKTAVHLDGTLNNPVDQDKGWSIEIALPWKALGEIARQASPPRDGDWWRVNFSRVQWQLRTVNRKYEKVPGTKEDNWVWSPQGVVDMHRPERWGYVQFFNATSGTARYVFDRSRPAREYLHRVYYAQREFRRKNARWATTFAELGPLIPGLDASVVVDSPVVFDPTLAATGSLFEASVKERPEDTARWHIRQDALIWKQ